MLNEGIVRYVITRITVTGYAPSEFNVANRNAFVNGLAQYLSLSAGKDAVSVLSVGDSLRRRKLLYASSTTVIEVKLLLTRHDSFVNIMNALDMNNSTAVAAMRQDLVVSLPRLQDVRVSSFTTSSEDVNVAFSAPKDEELKEYGGAVLAVGLALLFLVPILLMIAGIFAGPKSRLGLLAIVFLGEEKYAKLRAVCVPRSEASIETVVVT